jgi:hypothetical protein
VLEEKDLTFELLFVGMEVEQCGVEWRTMGREASFI